MLFRLGTNLEITRNVHAKRRHFFVAHVHPKQHRRHATGGATFETCRRRSHAHHAVYRDLTVSVDRARIGNAFLGTPNVAIDEFVLVRGGGVRRERMRPSTVTIVRHGCGAGIPALKVAGDMNSVCADRFVGHVHREGHSGLGPSC